MNLFDTFTLDDVRRTSDGYLAAFARVARTGIQEYRGHELGRPDLDVVRVYRPPEEVFHADALRSFAHRPVTLKHPRSPVTSKNWKKFAGGQTGEEVVRDGEFVRVPMVMMDQKLIDAYEKDGVKELSMGYSTDIQWRTGITDSGEPYDAVQTAIRGNHLAVVPLARGGDQLRIGDTSFRSLVDRLRDSSPSDDDVTNCPECGADIPPNSDKCPECGYTVMTNDGEYTMKLVIDGLTVNVADDQSGGIIERHIAALAKQVKDASDDVANFKKKKDEDDKEMKDAKATISAKDGEIAVLKKQVEDAKVTPAKLDEMVKDRLTVIDAASTILDKSFTFDGKTVSDIKRATVESYLGDAAKGMDDGAIAGAFVAATANAAKVSGGSQTIRDALIRRGGGHQVVDARSAAFDEGVKNLSNAWKAPARQ